MCREKAERTGEKPFPCNLFFIGFMGCGKSTISGKFGELFSMEQVEMDERIEEQAGMKISEIFRVHGEKAFRDMETEFLRGLCCRGGLAVSCGGGVPLRKENVELMKNSGKVIFLTASPQTIYERVKGSSDRPLLEGKKNTDAIREMIEIRRPIYEAAADFRISTDGKSIEEICREVYEQARR